MKNRILNRSVKFAAAVILAAGMVMTGCVSAASPSAGSGKAEAAADTMPESSALAEGTYADDDIAGETGISDAASDAFGDASPGSGEQSGTESEPRGSAANPGDTAEEIKKKIIYSADIEIQSRDYEAAKSGIEAMIDQYGAFVENSSEYNSGSLSSTERRDDRTWYVSIRVPSEQFDAFLSDTGNIDGMITSKTVSSSDMTKTWSDNEDKLKALQTEQERLLAILEKAESVDDMIAIESRLTEVRAQIASLTGENSSIDYSVTWSTVNLTLSEVVVYENSSISFAERVSNAFKGAGETFTGFFKNLLIAVIYSLPFAAATAAVIFIVLFAVRRDRIRSRKKKDRTESRKDSPADGTRKNPEEPAQKSPEGAAKNTPEGTAQKSPESSTQKSPEGSAQKK